MSCCSQRSYVPCGCKAILSMNDPRAPIWRSVLGCLEFPLQSPISHEAVAKGENPARFLRGDWMALSDGEKVNLVKEMKEKFGISQEDFMRQIRVCGFVPIKDQNISVLCCKLHSRMVFG